MKGQVSTEYLIILAVVLVIALVVVYLVSQSTGLAGGVIESQSQAYWKEVSPLAVNQFSAAGTTLSLEMINNAQETVTLTSLSGTGITTYAVSTAFAPGQTRVLSVTLAASCGTTGTSYSYGNITVVYSQGLIAGKTYVGQKPFAGKCS